MNLIKNKNSDSKLVFSILIVWFISASVVMLLISKIETSKAQYEEYLKVSVLNEAIAHYENIITARSWNASHNGLYILEHDGIKPNPYLKNNILRSDDNRTLIKINPAWMTRQISDISNKKSKHYYKMASLNPINPINTPDAFEKKALEYFEKNKNEPYYLNFKEPNGDVGKFDFMGSLKVVKGCLKCHAEQGYKVNDIRGGIRISLPLKDYQNSYQLLQEKSSFDKMLIIIFGFIVALLVSIYLKRIFSHEQEMKELNEELEDKVDQRTHELSEMNLTLEDRVSNEVQKNRKKDEAMLTQARHVAMAEMIEMVAHQWRQPISIIGLDASNILVDFELETDNKETTKAGIENIYNETQKLSKMITDITELFKSDSITENILPQNVVDDALSVMQNNLQEHAITIEKDYKSESEIALMSRELFQVYWNILNNAKDIFIQRHVTNPKITIEVLDNETEIITRISDNGGGIEDKHLSKIFEPYFSTSNNLHGKGLGLYVSKTITEQHLHGSLNVANKEDGAVFTISLPKESASKLTPPKPF